MAALQQLAQPAAWAAASPLGVLGTMDQAEELINVLANATACGGTWPEQVWISSNGNNQIAIANTSGTAIGWPIVPPGTSGLRGTLQVGDAFWAFTQNQLGVPFGDVNGRNISTHTAHHDQYGAVLDSLSQVWLSTFSTTGLDIYSSAGTYLTTYTAPGMAQPLRCAMDINNRIWVTCYSDTHGVQVFNTNGTLFGTFNPPGSYGCYGVCRVDRGGNSYMWVGDVVSNRVFELTPALALNRTLSLTSPYALRQIGSNVWMSEFGSTIYVVDAAAGTVSSNFAVYGASNIIDIQHVPAGP